MYYIISVYVYMYY